MAITNITDTLHSVEPGEAGEVLMAIIRGSDDETVLQVALDERMSASVLNTIVETVSDRGITLQFVDADAAAPAASFKEAWGVVWLDATYPEGVYATQDEAKAHVEKWALMWHEIIKVFVRDFDDAE